MPAMTDSARVDQQETISRMFPTLICVATSWEALPIVQALNLKAAVSDSFFGKFRGSSILLIKTGMGEAALKKKLSELPEKSVFSRVISTGFCGALKPELSTGDIVCESDSKSLSAEIKKTGDFLGLKVRLSQIAHAAEVLHSPKQKKSFAEKTGALAVDMETAPLKSWAKEKHFGCEFVSIRAVLDSLEDSLPPDPPRSENMASFIWYFLSHPMFWATFGRLYFKQKRASEVLVEFLRRFLDHSGDLK
jgi:purine-nucleoside phosphorylase